MTKKQYNQQKNVLLEKLESIRMEIEKMIESDQTNDVNDMYDKEYETETEIRFLDKAWETRNWTAAEWNTYELMTSNTD